MTIYLAQTYSNAFTIRAFTCKQLAEEFMIESNKQLPNIMHSEVKEIELVTDAFMELTLQPHKPKPFKELI